MEIVYARFLLLGYNIIKVAKEVWVIFDPMDGPHYTWCGMSQLGRASTLVVEVVGSNPTPLRYFFPLFFISLFMEHSNDYNI